MGRAGVSLLWVAHMVVELRHSPGKALREGLVPRLQRDLHCCF